MKLSLAFALLITFFLTSCVLFIPDRHYTPKTTHEFYFPSLSKEIENAQKDCIEKKEFPCNLRESNDSLSDFQNIWYSKHLKSLKEPILYNKLNEGKMVVRITNLGSWSHPFTFRIENKNDQVSGYYSISKGSGGSYASHRIRHERRELSYDRWNQIILKIDNISFWNLETHDPNWMILDGDVCIIEVLINGRYHFMVRNSTYLNGNKDFEQFCDLVIKQFSEN